MEKHTLNDLLSARNLRCLLAPVRESPAAPAEKQRYVELLRTMMESLSPDDVATRFQGTFMPAYINLLSMSGYFGSARDKYRLAAECTKSKILREAEFFAWVSQVKRDRAQQTNPAFWLKQWNHALIDRLLSARCGLIVATSKVGLMRHVPLELALAGHSIMLAASKGIYDLWSELFSESPNPPLVEMCNVENPAGALTIVRGLKANRILCINIEGETGAGGPWAQVPKYPVGFLSRQLETRNGLVRLSLRTGTPILPVIAVRTGEQEGELIYGKPFLPGPNTAMDNSVERNVLQELFTFAEGIVLRHPSQYESFSNLHRLLPDGGRAIHTPQERAHDGARAPSFGQGALKINRDRCVVIPHASGVYCVDPVTMHAVRIPPHRTEVIDFLMKGLHVEDSYVRLPRGIPDEDARCLTELVNHGMLQVAVPEEALS